MIKRGIQVVCFLMTISKGISFELQGHRGYRGLMPENTLSAFTAGIEAGCDRLELDLVVTKDGELVIFHDFFINPELCKKRDGSLISTPPLIYSLTLSEVKKFDCGSQRNPRFPKQLLMPGESIPTLQELFDKIASLPNGKKVKLNLEIKREPRHPEYTPSPKVFVKKLLDLVKKNGFSERVYYSSFDPEILAEVRKADPTAQIAFLKEDDLEGFVETALELKADIVSPEHIFIADEAFVHFLHELGFKVITWTVNDPERAGELIRMGVDGIITDYPELIRKKE